MIKRTLAIMALVLTTVGSGMAQEPADGQPRSTTDYDLQLPVARPTALSLLHFTATDSQGHTFLRQSFVLNKPRQEWTGNGLLLTGDSLSLNFEQTDRGLVVTVNAAVSDQGPTAVARLFRPAQCVPAPLRPFVTQYDTYLMRFADIAEQRVTASFTKSKQNYGTSDHQ